MAKILLERVKGDFGFEAKDAFGHTVPMDTSEETGGNNFGVRPMQMLLMGIGGCSAIDIVTILKKQRQHVDDFKIEIEGEREKGKEPSLWQNVRIKYFLKGKIEPEKAKRACELSMGKYCSVAATLLAAGSKITWSVKLNGE
ncbi:MAG TPA: OsmC family protein [Bacteroidia bacterium]|nr:OsmC family protein [Bacteroidia bacterium]